MIITEAQRLKNVKEYYFSKKLQQIAEMRKQGKPVLNLGIGSPDMKPSQETIAALAKTADREDTHGYQSYRSIPELRAAISRWYKNVYGVSLDSENEVLPLMGSKEGIMHISMAFLNPGDEVLVPNPGYPTYSAVSELTGATIKYYNLDENNNWAVDIDALRKADLSKVKIMWINYPNMPTGAKPTDKLFEELIDLARKNRFLLCNDNPYSLVLNDSPKSLLRCKGAKDVALELNSLSKSHNMAGWRLGWILGRKDYINTILKFKSNMDSGMFLAIQHAAIEALKNNDEWHRIRNTEYERRRKYVWKMFDILNCTYSKNQAGMFVWAKLPDEVEDTECFVEDILQKAYVFITPGFIFGSNGQRYLRISLCSKVTILEEAIKRIEQYKNQQK